jgi:hypothetical protein
VNSDVRGSPGGGSGSVDVVENRVRTAVLTLFATAVLSLELTSRGGKPAIDTTLSVCAGVENTLCCFAQGAVCLPCPQS